MQTFTVSPIKIQVIKTTIDIGSRWRCQRYIPTLYSSLSFGYPKIGAIFVIWGGGACMGKTRNFGGNVVSQNVVVLLYHA
jgi:hypothetical protein